MMQQLTHHIAGVRFSNLFVLVLGLSMFLGTAYAQDCPDLVPAEYSMQGTTAYPGESLTTRLSASVANIGDAPAGAHGVVFLITPDTTDPGLAEPLVEGIDTVSGVLPGDTVAVPLNGSLEIPGDWPLGPAYLVMRVDPGGVIQECNEFNNASFMPVYVVQQLDGDTTITVGPPLPQIWFPVPIKTAEYNGLGSYFLHPHPYDTVSMDEIRVPLYKDPGTVFNTSLSLIVELYTINDSLLPVSSFFVDTIPGLEIAAGWVPEDSIKFHVYDFTGAGRYDGFLLPPGSHTAVVLSQPETDTESIYTPASSDGIDKVTGFEEFGPCSWEDITVVCAYEGSTRDFEFQLTEMTTWIKYRLTGAAVISYDILKSVSIRYMDFVVNNWPDPIGNTMEVTLSSQWLDYMQRNIIPHGAHVLEVIVGGDVMEFVDTASGINWDVWGALTIIDVGMDNYDEGRHLVKVRMDGVEYFRDCFYDETRPLIDAAWADTSLAFTEADGGTYTIDASVSDDRIGFDYTFKILKKTFSNRLDVGADFGQEFKCVDGVLTNEEGSSYIELELMNTDVLDESIPFTIGESEVRAVRVFEFTIDEHVYQVAEWELFDGRIFHASVWAGAITFNVDASVELDLSLAVEAVLSTPPNDWGELTVTPAVEIDGGIEAELVLLWGAGKIGGRANAIVTFEFPLILSVSGSPPETQLDVDPCIDFDIKYKWWVKVWGKKVAGDNGLWVLVDGCSKRDGYESKGFDFSQDYYGSGVLAPSTDGELLMVAFVHCDDVLGEQIYCATSVGGIWGDPHVTSPTDDPKSDVQLAAWGMNEFAAIWVENDSDIDTAGFDLGTLYQALGQQEITVSTYDPVGDSWSGPERLTSDNNADGMPVLAGTNDRLYAVWTRCTTPDTVDLASMQVYYSVYNGESWTTPQAISGQTGYNSQPDVAVNDLGQGMIVWIEDIDADPYTPEDRSLRTVRIAPDGAEVPGSNQVVPSTIGPSAPSLTSVGSLRAVAYESWGYMEDSAGTMTQPVGIGDHICIGYSANDGSGWTTGLIEDGDTTAFGMGPQLTSDETGQLHLTYRAFEKNEPGPQDGEVMYTRLPDEPQSSWMPPLRLTDDSLTTYADAIAVDGFGRKVIVYRNDSLTGDFMGGMDKLYTVATAASNTPVGPGLVFDLPDTTSHLTFEEVTAAGFTGAYYSGLGPDVGSMEPVCPAGDFEYLHVTTTAEYAGSITLDLYYEDCSTRSDETEWGLFRYDGAGWTDITTERDTANNIITGVTDHLSTFVMAISTGCCQLRGDVNRDGQGPNIVDMTFLVSYLFTGGSEPPCFEEGDVTGDGLINIVDMTSLVAYLFTGGAAPVPCP